MTDVLEEIRRLREQNRDISNDDILLIQMIQIKEQLRDIDSRLQALEEAEKKHSEYPSLTYLLRYRPRDTMAVYAAKSLNSEEVAQKSWFRFMFR